SQLGEEHVFGRDTNRVNTALAKIEALTTADVQGVAAKYFQPQRATTLFMKPSVLAAMNAKAAATKATAVKDAPVQPSTAPVTPRLADVPIPKDYPTTAPTATPRANPEFAKGTESNIAGSGGVKVIVMP